MSRPFSYYNNPGRRSTVANNDRDIEMRPLASNNDPSSTSYRSNLHSSTVQNFIENLNSNKPWNMGRRRQQWKEKKKGGRSRFAVNIPSKLIFHVIIIFFLIPLFFGMILLLRALLFGLREDETHPLHKKLPLSHLKKKSVGVSSNTRGSSSSSSSESSSNIGSNNIVNESLLNKTDVEEIVDYRHPTNIVEYESNSSSFELAMSQQEAQQQQIEGDRQSHLIKNASLISDPSDLILNKQKEEIELFRNSDGTKSDDHIMQNFTAH